MKKLLCLVSMFAILATMTFGFSSCQKNSDEPENQVKVTNATGSMTLRAFTFKFFNASGERLKSSDVGVVSPGDSRTMEIPSGAASWRVGAYVNDEWEFKISPEYSISTKTLNLSYGDVHDGWTINNDRY